MTILEKALTFYAVAGVIIGALVASMRQVNVEVRGRPLPPTLARLAAFAGCFVAWPLVVFKLLTGF